MIAPRHRLLIADEHLVVRRGLCDIVAGTTDLQVVGEAADGGAAEALARTCPADLLILDIAMPVRRGIQVLQALRADGIRLPVLLFSMMPPAQYVDTARRAQAQGFVGKDASADQLLRAIRRVLAGGTSFPARTVVPRAPAGADDPLATLSRREAEVLSGIVAGRSLREIAQELGVGAPSITTYRRRLLDKLGARGNAELVALALQAGFR